MSVGNDFETRGKGNRGPVKGEPMALYREPTETGPLLIAQNPF